MCCESDVYNDLFQSVKLLEIFSVDFFLSPKPISMKLLVVMPTLAAECLHAEGVPGSHLVSY